MASDEVGTNKRFRAVKEPLKKLDVAGDVERRERRIAAAQQLSQGIFVNLDRAEGRLAT